MIGDDDELVPAPRLTIPKLDGLGVAELEAYIAALQSEIARAQAEIVRKRDHRSEADRLFSRS